MSKKQHLETLKAYFLGLNDFEREDFARRCKKSVEYIRSVMYGTRKCQAKLAIDIERESGGKVRCETLCPDVDFAYLRNTSAYSLKAPVVVSMQIKIPQAC